MAGLADHGIYLIDHTLGRMSYPALKEKAKAWAGAHRPSALLIEDKASGQSLVQELQLESSLPVVPVQVDTDKVARAWAIVPTWEARLIYLPLGAEWVDAFLEELYASPRPRTTTRWTPSPSSFATHGRRRHGALGLDAAAGRGGRGMNQA